MKIYIKYLLAFYLLLTTSTSTAESEIQTATFAGGCFWCIEAALEKEDGVKEVLSGYTGGSADSANYKKVATGLTRHREAVMVSYDPAKVKYNKLLSVFWDEIDPYDPKGQFCDKGEQYTTAIYYHTAKQKKLAEKSLDEIKNKSPDKEVYTVVLPAVDFYPAEEYHQNYSKKNPLHYQRYKLGCRRD